MTKHSARRAARYVLAALFAVILGAPPSAQSAGDPVRLLDLSMSPKQANALSDAEMRALDAMAETPTAMWPVNVFLLAEIHRLRGKPALAAALYRRLALASVDSKLTPQIGDSGLYAIALWRWAGAIGAGVVPSKVQGPEILDLSGKILARRATRRMWRLGVLAALPALREDLLLRLIEIGNELRDRERTGKLLQRYLKVATTAEFAPSVQPLIARFLKSGQYSEDRFALQRAQWLFDQQRFEPAYQMLRIARKPGDPEVVERATLLEARLQRARGDASRDILYTLDRLIRREPDPAIEEEALYMRAIISKKQGNRRLLRRDFNYLYENFPGGTNADDALIELGRDYQMAGDFDRALDYFQKVLDFDGPNDWLSTTRLQIALTRYIRWTRSGAGADLDVARKYLEELGRKQKQGTLHALAKFWLARIMAESGNAEDAKSLFTEVVRDYPYEYYGIRARIHLEALASGADPSTAARTELPGPRTRAQLRAAFRASKLLAPEGKPSSVENRRLVAAVDSGLYAKSQSVEKGIRVALPGQRLQDIDLEALAESHKLGAVATFLALRIDALAAKERRSTPDNLLAVSGFVMSRARDVPLGSSLVAGSGLAVKRHPAYLRTAYPKVFSEILLKSAGNDPRFASILYAIIRHESNFDTTAISNRSAYGLMQITPQRFEELDRRFEILKGRKFTNYRALLLDPEENIRIGALHFKFEILGGKSNRYRLPVALMVHNAGEAAVVQWLRAWKALGIDSDLELMIETARARETRNFVRSVLSAVAIVQSSKLFGE